MSPRGRHQAEGRVGRERAVDIANEILPRKVAMLVAAERDGAIEREERVGNATEDSDDDVAARLIFDPAPVILFEGYVEHLVGGLNAPFT